MAHHPNPNHNTLDPQIQKPITDLAGKRHLKKPSTTTSAAASAVYSLTNHFSRLHPNSKPLKPQNPAPQKLVDTHLQVKALSKPTKPQNPPLQKPVDTHLQVKALSKSVNFEPSAQRVGKQRKSVVFESDKKSLVGVGERGEKEIAVHAFSKVKKEERESGKEERGNEMVKLTRSMERVNLGGRIGRRRSFCDAQVELSNFLVTNCAKVVSSDMSAFMQIHAVGFARKTKDSLEKFTSKSLALSLKKEFDGCYGPAWHCIVGSSFGSYVTHSVGGFLYFSLDQKVYVLLFKTTVVTVH